MKYVDGYVLPVPKKNLPAYRRIATDCSKIWRKYGALKFRECVGDDLKTIKVKSFPGVVKPKHAKPWFSRGSCTSLAPIAIR